MHLEYDLDEDPERVDPDLSTLTRLSDLTEVLDAIVRSPERGPSSGLQLGRWRGLLPCLLASTGPPIDGAYWEWDGHDWTPADCG